MKLRHVFAVLILSVAAFAQFTTTSNYSLKKPAAGSTGWDTEINGDLDSLDSLLSGGTPLNNLLTKGLNGTVFADQFPGAPDLGVQINAAVASLPACSMGGSTWTHCGRVYISPSANPYKVSTQVVITSPFIEIVGLGQGSVRLTDAVTSGCMIDWTANPYNSGENTSSGGVYNLRIEGGSVPNTCGLKTHDIVGFKARNVSIVDFTGAGSSGFWQSNVIVWDERFDVSMELANDTCGWELSDTTTSGTTVGYGNFTFWINASAGQNAICSLGVSGNSNGNLLLDNSIISIHINTATDNSGSVGCANLTNSTWDVVGVFHCEVDGGSNYTGLVADPASVVNIEGHYSTSGNDAGNISISDSSYGTQFMFRNPVAATASANQQSPSICLKGYVWNGTSSALDEWCLADTINPGANGNSILQFIHGGSTGTAAIIAPRYAIQSTGSGDVTLASPAGISDFPVVTFPDASGTATLDIASGTATMTTAAITAGTCGATVTVAATGVLSTDVISWSFSGAPAGSNAGLVSWPTAGNVNFAYCPNSAETPAAATINWKVNR